MACINKPQRRSGPRNYCHMYHGIEVNRADIHAPRYQAISCSEEMPSRHLVCQSGGGAKVQTQARAQHWIRYSMMFTPILHRLVLPHILYKSRIDMTSGCPGECEAHRAWSRRLDSYAPALCASPLRLCPHCNQAGMSQSRSTLPRHQTPCDLPRSGSPCFVLSFETCLQ